MDRGELISKLELLPKGMKVSVLDTYSNEYVSTFFVWEEGHDHRHFVDLSPLHFENAKYNKPYHVGSLLRDLNKTYSSIKDFGYRNSIAINVANKDGLPTSNIQLIVRDNVLYLVGGTPMYVKRKYEKMLESQKKSK